MAIQNRSIAVFIDFENLALGYKGQGRFEIKLVLKRLLEKGKIVAKKAYCDWSRFGNYTTSLHEAAVELVEIPKRAQTGKKSADIRLCVDAMDLAYSKDHIDTFVVVSGDSDFSPLVSKLKELGKHVIGLGMHESTSALLRDNCDEFIYYEDLVQPSAQAALPVKAEVDENRKRAFEILFEGLQALRRENREVLSSPLVKITIKRVHPSFHEGRWGYKNWSALLLDAQREGLIELNTDPRTGNLVVVKFGDEMNKSQVIPQRPTLATPKTETKSAPELPQKIAEPAPVITAPAPVTPAVSVEIVPKSDAVKPRGRPRRRPTGTKKKA